MNPFGDRATTSDFPSPVWKQMYLKNEDENMTDVQKKNFDAPDEQHKPGRGTVDIVKFRGITLRRLTLQPGWRWTEDVKPTAKTEACQIPHLNVHITGRLGVKMMGGAESEYGPGDVSLIPPGHDAWVVGDEPVVIIEQTPTAV